MALIKDVRQDDGVTTAYHRILFCKVTTNRQNSIAVVSYVDAESRETEKSETNTPPYQRSTTYEIPYDESMTIESAYTYLKTLPQFEGAEDI